MEINFGSYWNIKIKDTHIDTFHYKNEEYYLVSYSLKCQRKIDNLSITNPPKDISIEVWRKNKFIKLNSNKNSKNNSKNNSNKVKNGNSFKVKLNTSLPLKLRVNNEVNFLDGTDICNIIINNKTSLKIDENTDSLIVKKVIPSDETDNNKIEVSIGYSYTDGVIYNLPVSLDVPNNIFQSKFSMSDISETLEDTAFDTENFTKNEIAGEIESLLNPSI